MSVKMIAAVSNNGIIGDHGDIPWKGEYPEDFNFFRQMTLSGTVIAGRLTYESIGKPLPKRRNIVVTSSEVPIEGVETAKSLCKAIDIASTPIPMVTHVDDKSNQIATPDQDNIWLIGGASIYREGLYLGVDEIYLTLIPKFIKGEAPVFLPWINPSQYKVCDMIKLDNSELIVAKYTRL